jgi:hypothetical protein
LRLRDIATTLGITDRSAPSIVTGLTAAGYVVQHKDGRRNRYRIQGRQPKSEGLAKAGNVANEDCVRLAAAIEPTAMPPINPISSTSVRYPPHLGAKVAAN